MILVVDDDKNIRLSLKLILERNEYEVALFPYDNHTMVVENFNDQAVNIRVARRRWQSAPVPGYR